MSIKYKYYGGRPREPGVRIEDKESQNKAQIKIFKANIEGAKRILTWPEPANEADRKIIIYETNPENPIQSGIELLESDNDKIYNVAATEEFSLYDALWLVMTIKDSQGTEIGIDRVRINQIKVLLPDGDPTIIPLKSEPIDLDTPLPYQHLDNMAVWHDNGLTCDRFLAVSRKNDFIWGICDIPASNTTVSWWNEGDNYGFNPGIGSKMTLEIKYLNINPPADDYMPPDNSWFGDKAIKVKFGDFKEERKIRIFFKRDEIITRDEENIPAWFYYWRQGVIPALCEFKYDPSLTDPSGYDMNTGELLAGYAMITGVDEPSFDLNNTPNTSYTEITYPNREGEGIHAVAKLCIHEKWHKIFNEEIEGGADDYDNDGLPDNREDEIGTRKDIRDTCGISNFCPEYSGYTDEELFCRWKQSESLPHANPLGDETKDWSSRGKQDCRHYRN